MPTFCIEEGIKIECYSGDHPPPHIHATYGGDEVLIEIKTSKVYSGRIPPKKLKTALKIVQENKAKLLAIFESLNPQVIRDEKNK